MKVKYQSELLGAIHETAAGLHKIGVINNKEMQEYDEDCIVPSEKPVEEEHTDLVTA
jgi:DNA-binding transcriptional regulator YiaG